MSTVFVVTSKTYLPEEFRGGVDPSDKAAIVNKNAKVGFVNMENYQQAVDEVAVIPKLAVHRSVQDWEITTKFLVEDRQTADDLVMVLNNIQARNDSLRSWTYTRLPDSLTVSEVSISELETVFLSAIESLPVNPEAAPTTGG